MQEFQTAFAVFLTIALVVGVVGNALTITIIAINKRLQTTTNVFVTNLAVADIVLLCVNLPTTIWELSLSKFW